MCRTCCLDRAAHAAGQEDCQAQKAAEDALGRHRLLHGIVRSLLHVDMGLLRVRYIAGQGTRGQGRLVPHTG